MASLNKVFLIGNLTKDPEVRYTPSGKPVGDLRMAVSRRFKTADGQNKEDTCYVSVVVWAKQAEICGEQLRKGSPIFVEGRLQYEEWEKEGQKFNRLRVVAERVQFLGPLKGGSRDSAKPAEEPPPQGEEPPPAAETGDADNLPF